MSSILKRLGFEYSRGRGKGRWRRKGWHKELKGAQIIWVPVAIALVFVGLSELWLRTYYDHYVSREIGVELATRIRGRIYTGRVLCSGTDPEVIIFRAFNHEDANRYLIESRRGCEIDRLMLGPKVSRGNRLTKY